MISDTNNNDSNKQRITIRIDPATLNWFRKRAAELHTRYQKLINQALKSYINTVEQPLESNIRNIIREELTPYDTTRYLNLDEKQFTNDIARYIELAANGEALIIMRDGKPIVELKPSSWLQQERPYGLAAGTFVVADDFNDPLSEDLLDSFSS